MFPDLRGGFVRGRKSLNVSSLKTKFLVTVVRIGHCIDHACNMWACRCVSLLHSLRFFYTQTIRPPGTEESRGHARGFPRITHALQTIWKHVRLRELSNNFRRTVLRGATLPESLLPLRTGTQKPFEETISFFITLNIILDKPFSKKNDRTTWENSPREIQQEAVTNLMSYLPDAVNWRHIVTK